MSDIFYHPRGFWGNGFCGFCAGPLSWARSCYCCKVQYDDEMVGEVQPSSASRCIHYRTVRAKQAIRHRYRAFTHKVTGNQYFIIGVDSPGNTRIVVVGHNDFNSYAEYPLREVVLSSVYER